MSTLRWKLDSGCRVRFLVGDPDGERTRDREQIEDVALTVSTRIRITLEHLDKLGAHEGTEARFSAAGDATSHVSLSVFRFDDEALATPHLARLPGTTHLCCTCGSSAVPECSPGSSITSRSCDREGCR